jgi:hypothetical protein
MLLWSCGQGGLTLPNTAFYLDPARRAQLEAFESTVAAQGTDHPTAEYPESPGACMVNRSTLSR